MEIPEEKIRECFVLGFTDLGAEFSLIVKTRKCVYLPGGLYNFNRLKTGFRPCHYYAFLSHHYMSWNITDKDPKYCHGFYTRIDIYLPSPFNTDRLSPSHKLLQQKITNCLKNSLDYMEQDYDFVTKQVGAWREYKEETYSIRFLTLNLNK